MYTFAHIQLSEDEAKDEENQKTPTQAVYINSEFYKKLGTFEFYFQNQENFQNTNLAK